MAILAPWFSSADRICRIPVCCTASRHRHGCRRERPHRSRRGASWLPCETQCPCRHERGGDGQRRDRRIVNRCGLCVYQGRHGGSCTDAGRRHSGESHPRTVRRRDALEDRGHRNLPGPCPTQSCHDARNHASGGGGSRAQAHSHAGRRAALPPAQRISLKSDRLLCSGDGCGVYAT